MKMFIIELRKIINKIDLKKKKQIYIKKLIKKNDKTIKKVKLILLNF